MQALHCSKSEGFHGVVISPGMISLSESSIAEGLLLLLLGRYYFSTKLFFTNSFQFVDILIDYVTKEYYLCSIHSQLSLRISKSSVCK